MPLEEPVSNIVLPLRSITASLPNPVCTTAVEIVQIRR
jgi:hypothetical protein